MLLLIGLGHLICIFNNRDEKGRKGRRAGRRKGVARREERR